MEAPHETETPQEAEAPQEVSQEVPPVLHGGSGSIGENHEGDESD